MPKSRTGIKETATERSQNQQSTGIYMQELTERVDKLRWSHMAKDCSFCSKIKTSYVQVMSCYACFFKYNIEQIFSIR
jgi:hypothetical protein